MWVCGEKEKGRQYEGDVTRGGEGGNRPHPSPSTRRPVRSALSPAEKRGSDRGLIRLELIATPNASTAEQSAEREREKRSTKSSGLGEGEEETQKKKTAKRL